MIQKMNKGTFRCIFGDHEYSEKETKDKEGYTVRMCKHCNLHGYYKNSLGDEYYIEYSTNGYRKRVRCTYSFISAIRILSKIGKGKT